ncbi:hypothetical protein THF5G08_130085 [Vibrio jasicida]|nr:hypothetical protein THF5G08_130085 [Vibrio jasicida]
MSKFSANQSDGVSFMFLQNISLLDMVIEFVTVIKLQNEVGVFYCLNDYSELSACILGVMFNLLCLRSVFACISKVTVNGG